MRMPPFVSFAFVPGLAGKPVTFGNNYGVQFVSTWAS